MSQLRGIYSFIYSRVQSVYDELDARGERTKDPEAPGIRKITPLFLLPWLECQSRETPPSDLGLCSPGQASPSSASPHNKLPLGVSIHFFCSKTWLFPEDSASYNLLRGGYLLAKLEGSRRPVSSYCHFQHSPLLLPTIPLLPGDVCPLRTPLACPFPARPLGNPWGCFPLLHDTSFWLAVSLPYFCHNSC